MDDAASHRPLAVRMRPRTLDEFVGQSHVLGERSLLRASIMNDRIPGSLIFYGPPGTGKTTLARIISQTTKAHFEQVNAVTAGVADIRRVIQEATDRMAYYNQKTVVFIDEIHRFNKAQQDALLPAVEDGTITLIGATTENPFFSITAALISRTRVIQFRPLQPEDIGTLIDRALSDRERGLGEQGLTLDDDARSHLIRISGNDARIALQTLELAAVGCTSLGQKTITLEMVEEASQTRAIRYDKTGDQHYDTISAFIKSIRGSDPDASLYWLAKMIEAGEDPRFIARRIIVHASEDIGNADPMALLVACSAAQALEWVGLPEARLALAQATVYLATAPKSNASYVAIEKALEAVRKADSTEVPPHLRDAHYPGASQLGSGQGYLYPHDYPDAYVPQQYLPDTLKDAVFYRPTERGYEAVIKKHMESRGGTVTEDQGR